MKMHRVLAGVLTALLVTFVLSSFTACGKDITPPSDSMPSATDNETNNIPAVITSNIVKIVSVAEPNNPDGLISPAGPAVVIKLKNVSNQPIVSLNATLELSRPFEFTFVETTDNPLPPGATASDQRTLIGGGFDNDSRYILTVYGTFQGGPTFTLSEQVQIDDG